MKTNPTQVILFLFCAVWFCSCNHYYYAPDEGHLLALSEKQDAKISIGASWTNEDSNNSSGKDFTCQAGYSPVEHLGLQVSYFEMDRHGVDFSQYPGKGNGYTVSGAVGTYYFMENNFQRKRKRKKKTTAPSIIKNPMRRGVLLDLYGGYSFGKVHNYYTSFTDSHLSFRKTYLQGGIHLQGRIMGLSYTLRGVRLDYEKAILNGDIEEKEVRDVQDIIGKNPFFLLENSLRFHIGPRQARFFVNLNFINEPRGEDYPDFITSTAQIGIILELDEIFRKQE